VFDYNITSDSLYKVQGSSLKGKMPKMKDKNLKLGKCPEQASVTVFRSSEESMWVGMIPPKHAHDPPAHTP